MSHPLTVDHVQRLAGRALFNHARNFHDETPDVLLMWTADPKTPSSVLEVHIGKPIPDGQFDLWHNKSWEEMTHLRAQPPDKRVVRTNESAQDATIQVSVRVDGLIVVAIASRRQTNDVRMKRFMGALVPALAGLGPGDSILALGPEVKALSESGYRTWCEDGGCC